MKLNRREFIKTQTMAACAAAAGAAVSGSALAYVSENKAMAAKDTSCTIVPHLKISSGKMAAFRALCDTFVEKTRTEPKCLQYIFGFHGDQAWFVESFEDAEGVLAHFDNVGSLIPELRKIADFSGVEVYGPEEELAKLRGPMTEFNEEQARLEGSKAGPSPVFFPVEGGFRR